MSQPTVRQALQTAQTLGLDRLDAQLLLLHALGKPDSDRAWLLAHDDDVLPQASAGMFRQLGLRRAAGEPLAYIVGYKEFFGLRLTVDARVLVPRPDTETLVAWSLDILQDTAMSANPRLLDLGTGSGAIAIAIAHSLQTAGRPATVVAVDASGDALAVAQENATRLHAGIQFMQSHWFEKVSGHFHLIASNPPYIASADPHLAALVHEPLQALTAGSDGLDDIRQIVEQAPEHLQPGGWLLLEHGYDQSDRVLGLLAKRGFAQTQSRLDLAGIARCSGGRWPG
ncbi:MAG: peptide chain release factor N(5)-glutamine methyltransferase [Pseudomonadota bacterium]